MVYWFLKHFVVGPPVRLVFRPWARGVEHVPDAGPAILASNHLSFSDSIFLPLMVPRRITFPAKMEYFTGNGVRGWLTKQFFLRTGQIPIDRSGGQKSMAALEQGLSVLRQGELFGIYPEGTRSPDGRLYRGKTGVARLALQSGAPVLPVAMIGTNVAQPIGTRIPRLRPIGVVVGRPLDFSRYAGLEEDRFVLRSITDEIMYEIMRLSGQEYVDTYAASVKARAAAAPQVTGAPGGRQVPRTEVPEPTEQELAEHGVNLVIYANHMLRAAYPQMVTVARTILQHGRALEADPYLASIQDALAIIPENQR